MRNPLSEMETREDRRTHNLCILVAALLQVKAATGTWSLVACDQAIGEAKHILKEIEAPEQEPDSEPQP